MPNRAGSIYHRPCFFLIFLSPCLEKILNSIDRSLREQILLCAVLQCFAVVCVGDKAIFNEHRWALLHTVHAEGIKAGAAVNFGYRYARPFIDLIPPGADQAVMDRIRKALRIGRVIKAGGSHCAACVRCITVDADEQIRLFGADRIAPGFQGHIAIA